MKFDIVRAWKDEAYRQTLSDEQLSSLPASPVGELELTSTELESVNGGQLGGFGGLGGIFGASLSHFDFHSLAFECNENTFSIVFHSGLNINSETEVHCTNHSNNHQNDERP